MLYINTIFRPEDYKMIDSNPEAEDNKENVDLKEEEIASKFLKSIHMFVVEDSGFLVWLCVEKTVLCTRGIQCSATLLWECHISHVCSWLHVLSVIQSI